MAINEKTKIDTTLLSKQEGLDELKSAFRVFGEDTINADDFGALLRTVGLEVEESYVKNLVDAADPDGTGKITFENFQSIILDLVTVPENEEQLHKAFKALRNQDGKVSVKELRHYLLSFCENCTPENVDAFFQGAPTIDNGENLDILKYKSILCAVKN